MNGNLILRENALSLSWRLFSGAFAAKYRSSLLGYLWLVVPPIVITCGVSLASQSGVLNPGVTQLPYPLFVFIGTLLWHVFAEAVETPRLAFENARSYLTQVHFAHEAIVLAQLYESLINTAIRFGLLLLMVVFYGGISWSGGGVLAMCFGVAVLFGLGFGALLMPFTLLLADLRQVVKLILSYGLFLTPAFYVPAQSGAFSLIVKFSPLTPLMTTAREAAAGISPSWPGGLVLVLFTSVALAVLGMVLVRISAPFVIERMLVGGR